MAKLDTGEILETILEWINNSEHLTDDEVLNNIKELMEKDWKYTHAY